MCALAGCGRLDFAALADSAPTANACPADAIFCDGFESGDISAWTGNIRSTGGTLVVEQSVTHSGAYALDAKMPAQSDGAASEVYFNFASISSGMLAARAWIYQPQPLINYDSVMDLSSMDMASFQYVSLCGANQQWVAVEEPNLANFQTVDYVSSTAIPDATWICVEANYTFGAPSHIALYVDDMLAVEHDASDASPHFATLHAAVARADAAGSETIIDDVVLATGHIGCN